LVGILSLTMVAGLGFAALGSAKSGVKSLLPPKRTKPTKLSKVKAKLPMRRKK
jgi:hypothetical protein